MTGRISAQQMSSSTSSCLQPGATKGEPDGHELGKAFPNITLSLVFWVDRSARCTSCSEPTPTPKGHGSSSTGLGPYSEAAHSNHEIERDVATGYQW